MISEEHFVATLVGCAVGDALGMPVESWPKARIQKHVGRITEMIDPVILRDAEGNKLDEDEYGKIHRWTEVFSKGEYTDDTILTLAIAESIIERGLPDLHHIAERQLQIYQEFSQGRSKCGFGGTTKAAFENLLNGVLPTESGVIGGPGTGPAMKMAPIGMWIAAHYPRNGAEYRAFPQMKTRDAGLYWAKLIGEMTHQDPRSVVCGIIQAGLIAYFLCNHNNMRYKKYQFFHQMIWFTEWEAPLNDSFTWHRKGDIRSRLSWILNNPDVDVEEAHEHLGSSSATYQAYPFTLWMFQKYWDDPIAGLEELVNCGGDCDTTGAMFGALAGAKHGMIFPDKWVSQIQNLDHIMSVGEKMFLCKEKQDGQPI